MRSFIIKNIRTVIITLLILYATLTPSSGIPKTNILSIKHIDKVIHFGMFFCLLIAIAWDYRNHIKFQRLFLIGIAYCMALALLTEFLQLKFYAERSGTMGDIIADLVGCAIASLTVVLFKEHGIFPFTKKAP